MRAIVQRVSAGGVSIGGTPKGKIGKGLVVLLAINADDNDASIRWMANKLVNLRIFGDENDKMNLSVKDIGGEILLISNFTLYGDAKKGFRPSFAHAAPPEISEPLYNDFVNHMKENYDVPLVTGEFGAMMEVEIINDGPVTLIIDK